LSKARGWQFTFGLAPGGIFSPGDDFNLYSPNVTGYSVTESFHNLRETTMSDEKEFWRIQAAFLKNMIEARDSARKAGMVEHFDNALASMLGHVAHETSNPSEALWQMVDVARISMLRTGK
jgi:hypothetical protein